MDELTYLLQCLGAEEITIRSLKGKKVGEIASEVKAIGTSFGNKIGSIGWDVNTAVNTEGETQNTNKIELAHHFTPKVQPYVPDGLVWYPNEARWHRIVEKRLHGTQIFFQEKISTSDVRFVSRNEVKGLEGEINYFNSHLKGSKKTESEIKLKSFEETEWEISVRFAPVESLRQVGENNVESEPNLIIGELEKKSETELIESMDFTDAEKIYMAECKELYVDGNEITISEKRLLNRLRESLAISKERAEVLEIRAKMPALSPNELEYFEEVKFCISEGEITGSEHRLLDRLRKTLNISEQRAKEIEEMLK